MITVFLFFCMQRLVSICLPAAALHGIVSESIFLCIVFSARRQLLHKEVHAQRAKHHFIDPQHHQFWFSPQQNGKIW